MCSSSDLKITWVTHSADALFIDEPDRDGHLHTGYLGDGLPPFNPSRATLDLKAASYCRLFILAILPNLLQSYGSPKVALLSCADFEELYTHYQR